PGPRRAAPAGRPPAPGGRGGVRRVADLVPAAGGAAVREPARPDEGGRLRHLPRPAGSPGDRLPHRRHGRPVRGGPGAVRRSVPDRVRSSLRTRKHTTSTYSTQITQIT